MRDYLPPGSALCSLHQEGTRRGYSVATATRSGRPSFTVGEFSTFPGRRGSLAHACWELWNPVPFRSTEKPSLRPTSPQAQKAVSCPPSSTVRRRTKPRWKPPQRLRALHSLAAFVSRNLFRPSARSAVLFLHSPHAESQVPRAGTPSLFRIPFSDPPRRRPPSFFGSRSRKDPKH